MSIPTEDDHDPDPPERGPLTLTQTVASALAWTWDLLATHPEAEELCPRARR